MFEMCNVGMVRFSVVCCNRVHCSRMVFFIQLITVLNCLSFQVEIKKEDRNVSGCVRIAVTHEDSCLCITLISADNLVSVDTMTSLNPVVLVYLLPNRG